MKNTEYIYTFEQLDSLLEKALSAVDEAVAQEIQLYCNLLWLGLTDDEISTAQIYDYNSNMRILHASGTTIYIAQDKIAQLLKARCDKENAVYSNEKIFEGGIKETATLSKNNSIEPLFVFKMGFFNMKHQQKQSGSPEDILREKNMIRFIGENECALTLQFADYESKI